MAMLAQVTQQTAAQLAEADWWQKALQQRFSSGGMSDMGRVLLELPRLRPQYSAWRPTGPEVDAIFANEFQQADKNQDGQLAENDAFWPPASSWTSYRQFDRNRSGGLDLEEYTIGRKVVRLTSSVLSEKVGPAKLVETYTEALRIAPEYVSALEKRAWICATSTDDSAIEWTGHRQFTWLETGYSLHAAETTPFAEACGRAMPAYWKIHAPHPRQRRDRVCRQPLSTCQQKS